MLERRLVSRPVSTLGTIIEPSRTQIPGPPMVTEGLIMYLDAANPYSYSGSGTTWTDLSGQGNNGTLVNGPTFSTENYGAITFDGLNDGVYTGTTGMNTPGLDKTLEAVIYFNNVSQVADIIRLSSATSEDTLGLGIYSDSYDSWYYEDAGSSINFYGTDIDGMDKDGLNIRSAIFTPSAAGIYHIMGVGNAARFRLYVNGVLQNTDASTVNGDLESTDKILGIGAKVSNTTQQPVANYFSSRIYLAKFYNRELSAIEVMQNFQAIRWRFGI